MPSSDYQAIVFDLDGTLLNRESRLPARTLETVRAASETGVRVMIATGRSRMTARPVLAELGLGDTATVFNGAGLYCPTSDRMLEERTLSNRAVERLLTFGEEHDLLTVVMLADRKVASEPRNERERRALGGLDGVEFVSRAELRLDYTMRVTFLADHAAGSADLVKRVEDYVDQPMYLTDFPLSMLPMHRGSDMQAVDAHAPCRGKAEALRALSELEGIPPERVVAVGDASNDVPMLTGAGLGVAMSNGMDSALAAADRVIGDQDSDTIAELVEELFL